MDISQTEKDPGGQMTSQARTRTRQCSSSKNCSEADIRKAIPSQQAAKQARPITPGLCREIGRASCRERVCQYGVDLGGRRLIKKKKVTTNTQCEIATIRTNKLNKS